MIAGVCGGLAQYFGIDPTIIRLVVVALTLAWGSGLLAYIIFWLVIPQEPLNLQSVDLPAGSPSESDTTEKFSHDRDSSIMLLGIAITVLGFVFLIGNFISLAWLSFRKLWPVLLIAIGLAILLKSSSSKTNEN